MYRLKHKPTGLYYQPHKHRGSNLSVRGKIYQTGTHGLSEAFKSKREKFSVYVENESTIHKKTKDILNYTECKHSYNQMKAETLVSDWEVEQI